MLLFVKIRMSPPEIFPTPEGCISELQIYALRTLALDFEGAAAFFQVAWAIRARIPKRCSRRML